MAFFESNKLVQVSIEEKAIYDKYKRCAFKVDNGIKRRSKTEEVEQFKLMMRKKTMIGLKEKLS
jgi:hypothetical protein